MKTIRVVSGEYQIENEIKRSRFIATAKGELNQDEAEAFVKSIKKKYPDATHNCYAYIADELGNIARFSDDGEPSGTAGQPIFDVIKKQGLVKTAIVVTRYFGGIKLGAGGLVGAYSGAAADVLKTAKIVEKKECRKIAFSCDYSLFPPLEKYFFKIDCKVINTRYDDGVAGELFVPIDSVDMFLQDANGLTFGKISLEVFGDITFESTDK